MSIDFEEEQRQINRLEFSLDYLNKMESWDKIYIELNTGEKPETDNALMKDALNRAWAFDGGKQAAETAKGQLASHLNLMQVIYEYTGNPLFAFRGLKVCLDAGLTPPEWIAIYMQESITRLMGYAYRDTAGKPDDPFVSAFKFRKGGGMGGGNWFIDYKKIMDELTDVLTWMKQYNKTDGKQKKAHETLIKEKRFNSKNPPSYKTITEWRSALLKVL